MPVPTGLRVKAQRTVSCLPNPGKNIQGDFNWRLAGVDLRDDTGKVFQNRFRLVFVQL